MDPYADTYEQILDAYNRGRWHMWAIGLFQGAMFVVAIWMAVEMSRQ